MAGAAADKRQDPAYVPYLCSDYDAYDETTWQDEDRLIEARRKRRREILEKHMARDAPHAAAVDNRVDAASQDAHAMPMMQSDPPHQPNGAPIALHKDTRHIEAAAQQQPVQEAAAAPEDLSGIEAPRPTMPDEGEYVEVEVDDDADQVDDMFNLDDTPQSKKTVRVRKDAAPPTTAMGTSLGMPSAQAAVGLQDNWDDPDGYYRVILGEQLDRGRYQVFAILGRGMFASVVRARDRHDNGREVAIKIVRRQETMYKAGMKEMNVLRQLAVNDPDDKKHVVRLLGHFEHRGHLCMVFESLSLNLREIVKRFGKDVGLSLQAVRTYAQQVLVALAHLRQENIMHADIKPDNIMVNETKTLLKLCDLGSASSTSEMEITPYLVSRFYRAPEIILGQPYGCEMDIWSMGCTLYELATGKILFPGKTNNHMLLLMQQLKGRPTAKQLKKCQFAARHFEDNNTFLSVEVDKSTGQERIRRMHISQPIETLRMRILPGDTAKQLGIDELRQTQHLIDLLNRMLELDPAKRITPLEALAHPFVR